MRALIIVALLLAACAVDKGTESYLAEYVALAGPGVDTTVMFPGPDAARHLIGPVLRPGDDTPLWLARTSMGLRFYTVTDSPRTLRAEARPPTPPGAPTQSFSVVLGDSVLETREMEPGWQVYELPLPADAIERGWNNLELRFARSIRPADYDSNSGDERELAARFRRIEIRLDGREDAGGANDDAPGRELNNRRIVVDLGAAAPIASGGRDGTAAAAAGKQQQPDVRTQKDRHAPGMRDLSAATIDMPADSMTEIFLLPRPDTELLAELSVTPGAAAEDLSVAIEAVDEQGAKGATSATGDNSDNGATTIWRGSPSGALWGGVRVRADLGGWAGRIVRLRIRVAGSGRGSVRFTGLRTRSATAAFDERLGIPEAVELDARARPVERPDIFVVLLDAARADALSGERGDELAPNVRELAAQGVSFRQAWSPSAWTGQSVPAVLTGMTPDTLGFTSWESRLPPGFDTLPGVLRAAGYYNFLFTQHTFYEAHDELVEDFDAVESVAARDRLPDPVHLIDEERPTFAFIHLLPPHDPYDAPEPFADTRSAWYEGDLDPDLDLLRGFYTDVPPDKQDEVRRLAISRYEENVAHADHLVGRIIAQLRELGRYDDAIVVLLSDHGEAFGEHGTFLHSNQLFEELIHVPLVIKLPRGRDAVPAGPTTVDAPVSTLDLAPTLLELAGIDDPAARFQGRSLAAALSGDAPGNRLILSQTAAGRWSRYAIRWSNLKLLYRERTRTVRLFDLATDPDERNDLAERMPLQTQALLQALRVALARNAALLVAAGDRTTEQLDAETIRRLRALGYLR